MSLLPQRLKRLRGRRIQLAAVEPNIQIMDIHGLCPDSLTHRLRGLAHWKNHLSHGVSRFRKSRERRLREYGNLRGQRHKGKKVRTEEREQQNQHGEHCSLHCLFSLFWSFSRKKAEESRGEHSRRLACVCRFEPTQLGWSLWVHHNPVQYSANTKSWADNTIIP